MKTLNEQHRLIKEGKGHKDMFLKEAKKQFPQWIRNAATYKETTTILKNKGIINENIVSLEPINQLVSPSKESYEIAFNNYLEEAKKKKDDNDAVDAKAEEKEASKQVKKAESKNFDRKNMENPDNLIFDQIMKGYYFEMKDEKNSKKTMEELKKIVLKNLTKDPIFYTKDGQFGVKDLGYTMDAPGLGEPKEPKGKWKASGYGDLKEGQVDMNKSYPTIKNNGTKIEYKGKPGTISGNFMVGGEEFASYKVKFDDGTTDEISTADKNIKFLEESLEESKIRKAINTMVRQQIQENVQKELMQINKDAEYEVLASKVERINAAIEKRQSQLDRLDEDEDLKNLTDKKKLKELAKDIKILEKAKSKIEKTLAKKDKASKSQPEIIDDGMIGEADGDADDAKTTADDLERAAKAAKEIGDTELFEEDENIDTENLKYE